MGLTTITKYKCPTECSDGVNVHRLEQISSSKADYTCKDCGMNVFLGNLKQYKKTLGKDTVEGDDQSLELGDTVNCEVV